MVEPVISFFMSSRPSAGTSWTPPGVSIQAVSPSRTWVISPKGVFWTAFNLSG